MVDFMTKLFNIKRVHFNVNKSFLIYIPKCLVEKAGLVDGDIVQLSARKGIIIIKRFDKNKLKDLIK